MTMHIYVQRVTWLPAPEGTFDSSFLKIASTHDCLFSPIKVFLVPLSLQRPLEIITCVYGNQRLVNLEWPSMSSRPTFLFKAHKKNLAQGPEREIFTFNMHLLLIAKYVAPILGTGNFEQ